MSQIPPQQPSDLRSSRAPASPDRKGSRVGIVVFVIVGVAILSLGAVVVLNGDDTDKATGVNAVAGGDRTPQETVAAWLAVSSCDEAMALSSGRLRTLDGELTPEEALADCESFAEFEPEEISMDMLELASEEDDTAVVERTDTSEEFALVAEDGEWRMDIMDADISLDPEAPDSPAPAPTGDPAYDDLAGACYEGDMDACDSLWLQSDIDSLYEDYGSTCGGRLSPEPGNCVVRLPAPTPPG